MPVRLLTSSVLKWPDREIVLQAFRSWAEKASLNQQILGIGLFGSLVQGNWGPESDLDMIIVLKDSSLPFIERGKDFDFSEMPVPVDLLVYTKKEWNFLKKERPKGFISHLKWVFKRFKEGS